eukprot:6474525-Amphidinium_carterae.1
MDKVKRDEKKNKENENKKYNGENNEEDEYDKEQEEMQTMIIYNDGSDLVKAYLSVHNVHIEDIMDDCTKSVTIIVLGDIQDKYTANRVRNLNTKFPAALQEADDNYSQQQEDEG